MGTVYGLRIVVSGIYHAAFVASDNRLELFTALAGSCTLDLSQGRLTALHQRLAFRIVQGLVPVVRAAGCLVELRVPTERQLLQYAVDNNACKRARFELAPSV